MRSPTHRSGHVLDHSFILIKISTSTTSQRLSCYPRTIVQGNSLPPDVFPLSLLILFNSETCLKLNHPQNSYVSFFDPPTVYREELCLLFTALRLLVIISMAIDDEDSSVQTEKHIKTFYAMVPNFLAKV